MQVKNNCSVTLGLPHAGPLEPGQEGSIADAVAQNAVVSAWISKGMLEVVSGGGAKAAPKASASEPESDVDEKEHLIEELAALGIQRDKRTSVSNLRKTLEDAKADQADDDDD